ncbi:ABC transporter substrate-binding protein [Azorhizobium oxalatiphilum]|uniref:ABC transporter substrate-binding protein n=1 Tax=Azorhizobium oxalatiphilum TaxID=980631 RepID=A0A917F7U3_9HYPH|nr:ABC transporter substrate-binding protein [Azorhizobium oxalatiphilum]GGF55222.1 ABC transporter substrate-binding protein [Azorhizobium oxalatiphilum]
MKFMLGTALAVLALGASSALAQQQVEVVMQYPYPENFNTTHKEITAAFEKAHPGIKVTFRAPYRDYEDAAQRVLREAITGAVPDITFQGLNRVRVLAEKNIAVPLDGFIKDEKNFAAAGFQPSMFEAGKVGGKVYGVPFAISLPIAYYNLDLVKKAGGDPDKLPTTWDEVIALAQKVNALGDGNIGLAPDWSITGNWFWQALVFENGGAMMSADERKVAFGEEPGQKAMRTLARFVTEAKAPNLSATDQRSAFAAGKVGIMLTTTAYVNMAQKQIGDRFVLKTSNFPGIQPGVTRLPPGGNVAVMTAKTEAKRKAAWEVLKFWTGQTGGTIMVQTTGYMTANTQAAEVGLKDFYKATPNQYTAVAQLPYMASWYAFPGENGLKITDVIKDHLQTVMDGSRAGEPDKVLADMVKDVQALIPATN